MRIAIDSIKNINVSGSWACISNTYSMTFSNRIVSVNDGQSIWAKDFIKYPSSNNFSYDTGRGYVQYYPASSDGVSGARAYSEAIGTIDGMGGSYTIFITVNVP